MKEQFYLKPNLVIEPLFDKWYAWSHLISPATSARNITGRHLKIMGSYCQAPLIHAAAAKNPSLKGGPFMDYGSDRSNEIDELKNNSLSLQKDMIEFSQSLNELEELLKQHPKGYSLEPLYEKVPDILKGYVELVYDLNNNPSYRLFEHLLYHSKFYNKNSQSIALWLTHNDERPFVLSTPRLHEPDILHIQLPFDHAAIDVMSAMKREPRAIEDVLSLMNLTEDEEKLFKTFFTKESPPTYNSYRGDKIRMRYFGHACILVETKDISILVDPLISYYGYSSSVEHFSDADLPEVIDYVLITHNHQDHILFETLLPLRHKIKNIVVPRTTGGALQDPNLKLMFDNIGFKNVTEISEMETIDFQGGTITGIPFIGEHSDLNIQAKICHHVKLGEFTMLFAADSCNVEPKLYEHITEIIGSVDIVFLGMECDGAPLSWLYGPLLPKDLPRDMDQSRRLAGSNYERALSLVKAFKPIETYVYAMGMEPWCEFISSIKYTDESKPIVASNKLVEYCKENNITAERLFGEKELLYSQNRLEEVKS